MAIVRNKFKAGSGCYVCKCCKHNTRDTGGDGSGVGCCDLCFELAGEENSISDTGATYGDSLEVIGMLATLDTRNGPGTAKRCFPEVCEAVGYGAPIKATGKPAVGIVADYAAVRSEGHTVTESIRTAVALYPDMTKAQAVTALVAAGLHPTTVRIQYANSRRVSATLV